MRFLALVLIVGLGGCATPDRYYPRFDAAPTPSEDASPLALDGAGRDGPSANPDGDSHDITAPATDLPVADVAAAADLASSADALADSAPDKPVIALDLAPDLLPPACGANERKCEGDTAMKCRADRSGFEVAEVCGGRVPYCYAGQCTGCGGGKGVCADGLCPANCPNETPSACYGDCGPVTGGDVRTGGSGILPRNNLWGECGPYQALVGGVDPTLGITCSFDREEYAHRATDCRAVDYAEDPATPNEFVSTCRDDELVAGLGKTTPGLYICCKARVGHKDCQRQASCRADQYAADVIASEQVTGAVMLWCCSP